MTQKSSQTKKRSPFGLYIVLILAIGLVASSGYYLVGLFRFTNPKNLAAKSLRKNYRINWSERFNVLLVGCDTRENDFMGTRSDTMILLNVDTKNKILRTMSIPRDTWLEIPGHDTFDKINSTINEDYFSDGGIGLTLRTVEQLIDMDTKLYIKVDFNAFKKIVDAIGGIDYEVEKDMVYVDPTDGTNINLKAGWQLLDGDKALQYVRFRNDAQGDFARDSNGEIHGRVSRQTKFMLAVAKKLTKIRNIFTINQLIQIGVKYSETNMDTSELLKFALLFRDIDMSQNLKLLAFPGYTDNINGISVVLPYEEELTKIIETELKPNTSPDTDTEVTDKTEETEQTQESEETSEGENEP
ncbi:LCP family protein [bacterium]|nr:LCP family protein [bacterium]